jgi:riboflavin synthase
MFSGIVETIGKILHMESSDGCIHFRISPLMKFDDLTVGDSISVNGVCLTVTNFTDTSFHVSAVPETLRLTNLGQLALHDSVNLERSLKLSQRIGGHYVQGHVDGMGQILDIKHDHGSALLVKISLPEKLSRYVVNKGYITLDGMSITIIQSAPDWFTVTFIPHTQEATITRHYSIGTMINIEVDILGKYVEKLIGAYTHAIPH